MDAQYDDIVRRSLLDTERLIESGETETPLVIAAQRCTGTASLCGFLTRNSRQVLADIAGHGALLLRGFNVRSTEEFEQVMLSIQGICGMREVLLSEPGRDPVDNTRFVFHTNALVKTGGTMAFGMFHSENYFLPDVPRYIAFFCKMAGGLGGETGLVNTARVYSDLPETTLRKLEAKACLVSLYPISEIVRRYGISTEAAKSFCKESRLPLITLDNTEYVAIYKPSVIQHPATLERTLAINFSFIEGAAKATLLAFLADYRGYRWALHRLVWRIPRLEHLHDLSHFGRYDKQFESTGTRHITKTPAGLTETHCLSELFHDHEITILASSLRRRYSSFTWKPGDVLIIDNLKMAHNGMPGHGKRHLNVMLCNRIGLPSLGNGPGFHIVHKSDESSGCLGDQLLRLSNPYSASARAEGARFC